MSQFRTLTWLAAIGTAAALVVSACSSSSGNDTSGTSNGSATDSSESSAPADGDGDAAGDFSAMKVAAVFSGPITDADYNQLGYLALQSAEKQGASITYTESVAVPDAERVLREYVADGNNVIWTHGSQFYDATAAVAADNPDIAFIAEFDGHPDGLPANVWTFDRQFHLGFYAIGVLASELTKSGKIGYVGGLSLPFSYAEVHAMQQALSDTGSSATLNPVWTSDFNDPTKAQQIATQLIQDGADVIVGSLNNGAVGTFKAAEAASTADKKVWVTAKYTDKSSLDSGGNYAGTVLYDFTKPLLDVMGKIGAKETTGYYPLGFSTGVTIDMPDSVPADVRKSVEDTMAKVDDGTVEVKLDTSKIGG